MDQRFDDIIEYVNINNIESLTIQPYLHDVISHEIICKNLLEDVKNIDFLERMPNLTEIRLIDVGKCDISGIYSLKNLKRLTVVNAKSSQHNNIRVEFNRLPELLELNIDWFSNGFDISTNPKLQNLILRKYCPQSGNFSELPLPKRLSKIELVQSNIKNLIGINSNTLESLKLSYCSKLNSLDGIKSVSNQLHDLIVDSAKYLTDYYEIKHCQELQKIVFVQCGNISSLNWVSSLHSLSYFVLEQTLVADGDMSNLLNIDKVAFTNKKHYNCKCVVSSNEKWRYKIENKSLTKNNQHCKNKSGIKA